MLDKLLSLIKDDRASVLALQELLVSFPALAPENGGEGEKEKADALQKLLASYGFPEPHVMNAPDARVPSGYRPNFSYIFEGEDASKTFWILSHLDVVPAGERSLWKTDPFQLMVDGDRMMGRGVEDNHQAIVSSVLLGKALVAAKAKPPINLGLLYLADEETANFYGIEHVLKQHGDLFKKGDLFLVPDYGEPDGLEIEVAEKGLLWLKVTLEGKQCHASTPDNGVNSLRAAAELIVRLEGLAQVFPKQEPLFSPQRSTFEPTKKEANVDGVNIIPGHDVFYLDCRVLPDYGLDDVLREIKKIGAEIESKRKVKVYYDVVQKVDAAPATPFEAEIVRRLQKALREAERGEPKIIGIGGGTFAAPLRREGYAAAVWATLLKNPHQPNETALVSASLTDAQIMARVLWVK